jgi:hypothetical protein
MRSVPRPEVVTDTYEKVLLFALSEDALEYRELDRLSKSDAPLNVHLSASASTTIKKTLTNFQDLYAHAEAKYPHWNADVIFSRLRESAAKILHAHQTAKSAQGLAIWREGLMEDRLFIQSMLAELAAARDDNLFAGLAVVVKDTEQALDSLRSHPSTTEIVDVPGVAEYIESSAETFRTVVHAIRDTDTQLPSGQRYSTVPQRSHQPFCELGT